MKKTILIYGLLLALLTFLLKFIEYRFLVRDLSIEFYVAVVAVFFTALGIWVGLKLTGRRNDPALLPFTRPGIPSEPGEISDKLGISKRELEVLHLMALGHSNQEIADELFLSLNTVKTHSSNLYSKLDVKRRTQAVQKAKELGLIPA